MKLGLIFLSILLCFQGYSQSFTLNEFIGLLNKKDDQLDTYLTKKGYQFYNIEEDKVYDITSYVFKVKGLNTYFLSKMIRKSSGSVVFKLQTPSSNEYLKMKNEAVLNKFKYVSKESAENSLYFFYENSSLSIIFGTFKEQVEEYKNPRTGYKVYVEKLKG